VKLILRIPTKALIETETGKIVAEGTHGAFVLLPRHADIVAPLPAGVLGYDDPGGGRVWVGHDEAVLVKCGPTVSVAALRAALGPDIDRVRRTVREEFLVFAEREAAARGALGRLEASLMRRMLDMEMAR
jgi:alternate F1F0 ATPase F1 subunit epsilon